MINREDIIAMAREAGLIYWTHNRWFMDAGEFGEELERFAALIASRVAEHIRETEFKPDWNNYRQGFADGAAEEREACAELVDANARQCGTAVRLILESNAAAIRARGETSSRGQA